MANTVYFTNTGYGSWTVPAGVTSINVQAIAGGQSGHGLGNIIAGSGGGYACTSSISVVAGATIYFYVGIPGANSWINISANSLPTSTANGCLARGSCTSGGIGTVVFYGGIANTSLIYSSGGGGAAGPNGNGQNGGLVSSANTGGGGGGSDGGSSTAGSDGGVGVGGAGGKGTSGSGGGAGGNNSAGANGINGGGGGGGSGTFMGGTGGSSNSLGGGYGPGGGGGGYGYGSPGGGTGGLYGGGAGSPGGNLPAALGGQGIVAITYSISKSSIFPTFSFMGIQ